MFISQPSRLAIVIESLCHRLDHFHHLGIKIYKVRMVSSYSSFLEQYSPFPFGPAQSWIQAFVWTCQGAIFLPGGQASIGIYGIDRSVGWKYVCTTWACWSPTQVEKTKQGDMHNVAPTSSLILERTSFASFPLTSQSKVATTWRILLAATTKRQKNEKTKWQRPKLWVVLILWYQGRFALILFMFDNDKKMRRQKVKKMRRRKDEKTKSQKVKAKIWQRPY